MGVSLQLLQLVDEIARFTDSVKRIAIKRAGMTKAAEAAALSV
ncbi:hypothetical protein [Sphingopyxis sp. H050]|jgi:hypothetical protein|nr:hypothetical protein [Sphingopyxis sp. H050]